MSLLGEHYRTRLKIVENQARMIDRRVRQIRLIIQELDESD